MQRVYAREPYWKVKERQRQLQVFAGRQSWKKRLEKNADRKRLESQAFARAKDNREHPTPAESNFKAQLTALGIRFIHEYVYFYKSFKYRIIDFYLPDYKLSVELDGGYHKAKAIQKYDRMKDTNTLIITYRFQNEAILKPGFWQSFNGILRKRKLRLFEGKR